MTRDIDDILWKRGISSCPPVKEERWLTREEAVALINEWKKENIPKYNLHFSTMNKSRITSGVENVYLTVMTNELIERIRNSDDDPITTVAEYTHFMDNILAVSDIDHTITHQFTSYMGSASYDVLLYLKETEKEMNALWE